MPRDALQGGLCRVGRRMTIVGHAGCQVIEGSEIEYPSAVARCELRMEPGLPQAVPSGRSSAPRMRRLGLPHDHLPRLQPPARRRRRYQPRGYRARPSPDVGDRDRRVRSRHEGASFSGDVFLISEVSCPMRVQEVAEVTTTRVKPEFYVPPRPLSGPRYL